MPCLRDAEPLGLDDEVLGQQIGHAAGLNQGPDLIGSIPARPGEITADPREHRPAAVVRREQTLDVLHHEYRGSVRPENPQVLPVQEVLLVLLEGLVMGPARAASERVRLARRTADENPVFDSGQSGPDPTVDFLRPSLSELGVEDLRLRMRNALTYFRQRVEVLARRLASQPGVVRSRGATLPRVAFSPP